MKKGRRHICFLHDGCDWIAREVQERTFTADHPWKCDECQETLPAGTSVHNTFMQEYEECRDCYRGDCECPDGDCCQCKNPSFGEDASCDQCDNCVKFLRAVQEAEEDEGCQGNETRPGVGSMVNDISDGGRDEAKRYFKKALRLYPELARTGYLGRLWRSMFV